LIYTANPPNGHHLSSRNRTKKINKKIVFTKIFLD
jgi:hypothetical protein